MDDKQKVYRPQHFVTVEAIKQPVAPPTTGWSGGTPDANKSVGGQAVLPDDLKGKPELVELLSHHQAWLGQTTTLQTRRVLRKQVESLQDMILAQAVDPGVSDATVRLSVVRLHALIECEKVVYDSETFIRHVVARQ